MAEKQIYLLCAYSDSPKEGGEMGLRSRLGIEYKGMFFFAVFYLVAGVVNFIIWGTYGLSLFHVALVAVLSLVAAFGVYQMQSWSLWLVIGLFFITTTYGAFMVNVFLGKYAVTPDMTNLLTVIMWIIYLLLTWIATVYVAARRKSLR
jgi:ABC-type thiamin/hydroxymethylpyrimidine transport system permease subunit